MKENLQKLINAHRDRVKLVLRQFQIHSEPTPEVLQSAYSKYGMTFQKRLLSAFEGVGAVSNYLGEGITYWYNANTGGGSTGGGTSGGGFWNVLGNIIDYGGKALNTYASFKNQSTTGASGDSSGGRQPIIISGEKSSSPNTNVLIIAGIAVVALVLIIVLFKKQ